MPTLLQGIELARDRRTLALLRDTRTNLIGAAEVVTRSEPDLYERIWILVERIHELEKDIQARIDKISPKMG